MVEIQRPLDALNDSKEKRVLIELKNGTKYSGILKAFDIHINIVLSDAEQLVNGEVKRKLGKVFIRGDTITLITSSE
jgi:small nuclear ribonucleoprotein